MLQQLQHEKLRLARVSWSKHALNYTCTSLQNTINPVQKEIFPLFSHSNCALKLKSKQKESNTAQSTKKKKKGKNTKTTSYHLHRNRVTVFIRLTALGAY